MLLALRWRMNAMSLPEEEARALGLRTGPLRLAIVAAATLVTAASVAAAGIIGWVGLVAIQLAAFAGGLLAVGAVEAVGSTIRRGDPVLVLVLTGVVIGSLLGAGIGLVKYWADPYNQLPAMTFWLLGSLAGPAKADLVPLSHLSCWDLPCCSRCAGA